MTYPSIGPDEGATPAGVDFVAAVGTELDPERERSHFH